MSQEGPINSTVATGIITARKMVSHICQGRRHAPEKNQDFAISGTSTNRLFDYLVVADGHDGRGGNYVNKYLRDLDWDVLLEDTDFMDKIYDGVQELGNTSGCGSTLTIAIITAHQAEIYWIGDSQCRVYKNLEEIWASKNHDQHNEEEIQRLNDGPSSTPETEPWRPLGEVGRQDGWRIELLSQTEITMEPSPYFVFNASNKTNMTHSLGHNGLSGKFWSEEVIDFTDHFDYKIVVGSDGLWDMVHYKDYPFMASRDTGCEEMLQLTNNRWKQEWKYYCPTIPRNEQKGDVMAIPDGEEDDTSVAVWYRGI
jgi:serine/threonine protein phosphatase PrpC